MDNENQKVETFEMSQEAMKAMTDSVVAGLTPSIEKITNEAIEKKLESIEKVEKKNIGTGANDEQYDDADLGNQSKELRLMRTAIALARNDQETLSKYRVFNAELRQKSGYANSTTDADGGYILADPEFESAVEKLETAYGVALVEADVRRINSNSIKTNKRAGNVTMYKTGEGVAKTGTKLTISQFTVTLEKYAAIAIATDELVDDSAIDFWNEVTQGFAEERARLTDIAVFTSDDATYPGILNVAGTITETIGDTYDDITWDDLLNAEAAVPTKERANGKHYMHRTLWNVVIQSKDDEGRYQWFPQMGEKTPWGRQVVLVDVMPDIHDVGANEAIAVYGNLKRVKLYMKKGLELTVLKEGMVKDTDGTEVNLGLQDMTALRAVTRFTALTEKFPEAFCIIGTGTVS